MSIPFLGSGKLVKNYNLLMKYFEKLKDMGMDSSVSYPRGEDLGEVKKLVERGAIKSLDEAVKYLIERFKPRIVGEAAKEAVREVLGIEASMEVAIEHVAKVLALWTLEMGESMGLIKIVGAEKYLR